MNTHVTTGNIGRDFSRTASSVAALLVSRTILAIALLIVPVSIIMADAGASGPDQKCVKCHSKNLKKSLEDGEKLSLHVAVADFQDSVHNVIGCTGCHRDIATRKHPSKQPIDSRRTYSIVQNETCRQCHAAKFEAYEGSIHASLVADGNLRAPLCTDCHSAHAVKSMAIFEPLTGQPCKTCHEDIFDAYAGSVHGEARANGNVIRPSHIQAPICADCHRAHDITAVAASDRLKTTCLDCHEDASLAHEQWLPNAGMHLGAVSCPACHAPMAQRRVDLQLFDNLAEVPVGRRDGHSAIQDRLADIDTGGDGLDPIELWKLVRQASREGQTMNVILRGRMEVTTGVDAHRLAAKTEAVRSCESCHQGEAEAFKNVTVSISRPDGRKQRFDADSEVLKSAISVDSVGGFYAPGGTRIRLLDGMLILAVIGGLAIPVGHITLGKFLRKKK